MSVRNCLRLAAALACPLVPGACAGGGGDALSAPVRRDAPQGASPPVAPWLARSYRVPADSVLEEELREALRFRRREDFELFLDARDEGELLEHASLTQTAIDRGIFGLDALFAFGDELFDYEFRPEQGLGNDLRGRPSVRAGRLPAPNMRRVHEGGFGGPDSFNCATCHFKGGPDGAGNTTQNAFLDGDGDSTLGADERNPPHVLGLGPVAALAREMSAELTSQRDAALAEAGRQGEAVETPLAAKGVSFGSLRAFPDGTIDTSPVAGVDPDLVVKPFGWKGHQATLRGMVEESFRIHLGIVSMPDQRRLQDGGAEPADFGDGPWADVDRDGTTLEIDAGMLTTMVAYLAQLEAPVIHPPQTEDLLDAFARGSALFDEIGCGTCHRPYLELADPILEVGPPGPGFAEHAPIRIDVTRDGDQPKVEPQGLYASRWNVHLFSDLRRHDMGPELASPSARYGIAPSVFLTRPLWGLAFTAPYLHDGRAPTVDDAIRLHGGEALAARDAYLAREPLDRAALQIFLLSLTREPELFVP